MAIAFHLRCKGVGISDAMGLPCQNHSRRILALGAYIRVLGEERGPSTGIGVPASSAAHVIAYRRVSAYPRGRRPLPTRTREAPWAQAAA